MNNFEQFMSAYGFKPSQAKKSAKDIPGLLHEYEEPHAIFEAQFKDVHKKESTGYGIVLATNRRILSYRKSFIGTVTSEEIPLSKITGISYRKGLFLGSVIVTSASQESIFDNATKQEAEKFANTVKKLISDLDSSSSTVHQKNSSDPLDKLEKLHSLLEKGILTPDEFAEEKRKLLS